MHDVHNLDELARRALTAYTAVYRNAFMGDPAANPRLTVEVLGAGTVGGCPTLVVVTPWTMNGLIFPPDGTFPGELSVAGRRRPVYVTELEPLGSYHSVNLVSDVSQLHGPEGARNLARSWVEPFRTAVEEALAAQAGQER